MKHSIHQKATLSRSTMHSLDAYKAWIMEIARQLTTQKTELELTEQEWRANWKAFLKEKTTH
ncbi:MAG: hypothetical protein ABIU06_17085 [Anaerolineales bacterium]